MSEPVNFTEEMIEEMMKGQKLLDETSLRRFTGGQAMVFYPQTKDRLAGNIEAVSVEAGCVEISCGWIAHKKKGGRTWRYDSKRTEVGFLTVQLRGGWEQTDRGLVIFGVVGNMILHPTDGWFIPRSDVRDS